MRATLLVEVDLDPAPGTFHTASNARIIVEAILNDRISHYNPTVEMTAHTAWAEYLEES